MRKKVKKTDLVSEYYFYDYSDLIRNYIVLIFQIFAQVVYDFGKF